MNKILLFLIIVIIGSALSTGDHVSNEAFDCTTKAIKVCGADDDTDTYQCQVEYVKRCEKKAVVNKHKTHHSYKTTISEKNQRICITESNCNCKTIATTQCQNNDGDYEVCYNLALTDCQTRCKNSRSCYRVDCSDAGENCHTNSRIECALKHADDEDLRVSCVEKKTSVCKRFEKANCKRAIRVFQFRSLCAIESQKKCQAILDQSTRCNCITTTRHACLIKKVEQFRQKVRDVYGCKKGAKLICADKKCEVAHQLCIERETKTCEPVCKRQSREKCNNQVNGPCYENAYKTCIKKWKRTFCDYRALIKCVDKECVEITKSNCLARLPPCFSEDVSCDDNNACTDDFCDVELGCVNKPRVCDDNNACTTDSCDPVLGCVYKSKKCDDGIVCTRDSCDKVTGECKYEFDSHICHVCSTGPCQVDSDCIDWETSQNLAKTCQYAKCNPSTGSCYAVNKKGCADVCKQSCIPYHACDNAQCQLNNAGKYDCVHTPKDCNDYKDCTIDSCDQNLGCVHKYNKDLCPPNTPICDNDAQCANWETSQNLRDQCQKASCDVKQGICVAVTANNQCTITGCQQTCHADNACETATCVEKDGYAYCQKTPIICDDKKACTVDSCDTVLGCVFKYTVRDVCPIGCDCNHNEDCKAYEQRENLSDKCQTAVCDQTLGACVAVPLNLDCSTKLTQCQLDCQPNGLCDDAQCVKDTDSPSDLVCQHNQKTCDDGNQCTLDSCDDNLGCVHVYQEGPNCPSTTVECKIDSDCLRWGFTQKCSQHCQKAVCDTTIGHCKVVPKEKKCRTITECQLDCTASNPCETAACELNSEGDYYCKRVSNSCDDNNGCTVDSCDTTTGACVNTPLNTPECSIVCDANCQVKKCRKTCVPRKNCELANCIYDDTLKKATCTYSPDTSAQCNNNVASLPPECQTCVASNPCESVSCINGQCVRTQKDCNDHKSCTVDSCDITTGLCVNTYTTSQDCTPNGKCDKNIDCKQWGIDQKLDICLTPVCDSYTGSCKAVPNDNDCSPFTCDKVCPPKDKCSSSTCRYDASHNPVCKVHRRDCDDGNKCTVDSCDVTLGCVNKLDNTLPGCSTDTTTPICKTKSDCDAWSQKLQLAGKCQEAYCDATTNHCKRVYINSPKCNPLLDVCKKQCVASDACESADCVVDADTNKFTCVRTPVVCNDNNDCTKDICDAVQGCKFPYVVSDKCEQYCNNNNDCAIYGLKKNASLRCKEPYCDKKTTSCRLRKDTTNTSCKDITPDCQLLCQPRHKCETAKCVRKGDSNNFDCIREPIVCNDNKDCTEDSCNKKTGCVFTFKKSPTCSIPCDKDLDCVQYAKDNKLEDQCKKAVCSSTGSCIAVAGVITPKCLSVNQCNVTSDCDQSDFGSVCCTEGGLKKCCKNECQTDTDCKNRNKKTHWGYCQKQDNGKKKCHYRPKCKLNEECDDKNPCTRDVCVTEYGFCKYSHRCADNSQCTLDICIPSTDGTSYTCKNPSKCCTNNNDLLDKNFDTLSKEQQTEWLGKCSHATGCIGCVVNAQCDDNNGCTDDSCVNQFCVNKPIDNKWCDPVLEGQPITVEGYFPTFVRI